MQTFSLVRYRVQAHHQDDEFYAAIDLAVPLIDGNPLFLRVGERYPGVAMDLVAPASRQWLGDVRYGEGDRAVVLDGECGIAGCCGSSLASPLQEDLVVWSDFFARGHPEVPQRLHFAFERAPYEHTIAAVDTLSPMDWRIDLGDHEEDE